MGSLAEFSRSCQPLSPPAGLTCHEDHSNCLADPLARQFADSWRVRPEESLFTYPPGKSTADFTNRAYPNSFNSLSDLSPDQLGNARAKCNKAGVAEPEIHKCLYDIAFTNQDFFARTNAQLALTRTALRSLGLRAPLAKLADPAKVKESVKRRILDGIIKR